MKIEGIRAAKGVDDCDIFVIKSRGVQPNIMLHFIEFLCCLHKACMDHALHPDWRVFVPADHPKLTWSGRFTRGRRGSCRLGCCTSGSGWRRGECGVRRAVACDFCLKLDLCMCIYMHTYIHTTHIPMDEISVDVVYAVWFRP